MHGRTQVTEVAWMRLQGAFELEERGVIEVKGKGLMRTWFLNGRKEPPEARENAGVSEEVAIPT